MQINTGSNIWKLYLIKLAKWFMLFMPYVVPFYMDNGLDMQKIMILQSIYSVSIIALEIPSGYFADVVGRKRTLIAGTILGTAGFALYSFSYGFTGFLIAELVLGFGQSLISGADSALLYDSLLDQKRSKEYIKVEGRMVSAGNIAEASASLVAGILALISLRTNFYAQTLVASLAIPAAFYLVEPMKHKRLKIFTFSTIIKVVNESLFLDKKLRTSIYLSAVIGASTLTMAWFAQPYFLFLEIPLGMFGLLWTLLNLTVGAAAFAAYRIESRLGSRNTVLLISLFIPAGFLLLGSLSGIWTLSILFVFYAIRGIATPVLKDYIHILTKSETRATVLSVRNFVIRIIFVMVGPLMGKLTDSYDIQTALISGGTGFLAACLILSFFFLKMTPKRKT